MADLLECPVCLEAYTDPQLLPSCGHTFCRGCIESIGAQRCPTCRAPFARGSFRPNFALRLVMHDTAARRLAAAADPAAPLALLPPEGASAAQGPPLPDSLPLARPRDEAAVEGGSAEGSGGTPAVPDAALDRKIAALQQLGVPWGLARLVCEEDAQTALRIFLLDNSGSTSASDGKLLVEGRTVTCTRWQEIKHMAEQHAKWSAQIGTPCEFTLLNPPSGRVDPGQRIEGVDFARIDHRRGGSVQEQCAALSHMLNRVHPRGLSPLVERIRDIHRRVADEQAALAQLGQRVVLIIVTDGLPTSEAATDSEAKSDFAAALRSLSTRIPVNLVIRLATSEDVVVNFYQQLDEELEIALEVLDDMESEAREIASKGNGWLTYSSLIHTLREQGTFVKLFDLLDERRLTAVEAMILARLLLQRGPSEQLPQSPEDFCRYAEERLRSMPLVHDPLAGRPAPVLRVRELYSVMVPLSHRLTMYCARRRQTQRAPLHRVLGSWLHGLVDRSTAPSF